jgi:Protein of unknown function (DUF3223)
MRVEKNKMPAKPITIGSLNFAKRGDANTFLRDMLNRYDIGDRVSAADEGVLRAALPLHPQADEKIGCGVTHFSVRSADFGTKCFWVNRLDGTTEKFSYKTCIRG